MGIEFRGSYYKKDVSFGKRTIKDGEAAAIWNRLGVHRQVIGPRLTRLFFSTIVFLDKRIASSNEYLVVTNVDGTINHVRGPVVMFENPVLHRSIIVKPAYLLTSESECLVVNHELRSSTEKIQPSNSKIERGIVKGPKLYIPLVGDSVVNFDWHGTIYNEINKSYTIKPSNQKFTVLNTSSRQWKIDFPFLPPVNSNLTQRQRQRQTSLIETKPGTIQLTFTFSINSVENLVNHTTDLIGDLYDAIVIDLTNIQISPLTSLSTSLQTTIPQESKDNEAFEQFSLSTWMISTFSSTSSFPNLLNRSQKVGVIIEGVLFRGYEQSPETKQELANLNEIELKSSRERLKKEQEQYSDELNIRGERIKLEKQRELEEVKLNIKTATLQSEQNYYQSELTYKLSNENAQLEHQLRLARERNNETLRVLKELNNVGVDLTKFLCHVTDKNSNNGGNLSINEQIVSGTALEKIFDLNKGNK